MNDGNPLPPRDVDWLLPRHPRSVRRARGLLRVQALLWRVPEEAAETAVLLLSELMTNAVRHAHVPQGRLIKTRCMLDGKELRVEVSDAGDELPQPRTAGLYAESGRGLALVAALADDWNAQPRPSGVGKTVWFTVNTAVGPEDGDPAGDGPADGVAALPPDRPADGTGDGPD
ncbi:ATP-binding protein [Streptomyces pactum]|uniref:ATP-binding protein n=1 Tax=Streptomyces pactum TaxID=68249 RepID=UPI0036FD1B87